MAAALQWSSPSWVAGFVESRSRSRSCSPPPVFNRRSVGAGVSVCIAGLRQTHRKQSCQHRNVRVWTFKIKQRRLNNVFFGNHCLTQIQFSYNLTIYIPLWSRGERDVFLTERSQVSAPIVTVAFSVWSLHIFFSCEHVFSPVFQFLLTDLETE